MNNENLNATLRCVTRPSAAQEEKIKTFLKNKYQAENITLTIKCTGRLYSKRKQR